MSDPLVILIGIVAIQIAGLVLALILMRRASRRHLIQQHGGGA